MVKTPRAFRLSDTTLNQIEWLKFHLGDITATDAITVAVAELYHRKKAELPTVQLVPLEDGTFNLQVHGETALHLSGDVMEHLPEEFKQDLISGSANVGDALVYLVLVAAKGKEKIGFIPEVLKDAFQDKIE